MKFSVDISSCGELAMSWRQFLELCVLKFTVLIGRSFTFHHNQLRIFTFHSIGRLQTKVALSHDHVDDDDSTNVSNGDVKSKTDHNEAHRRYRCERIFFSLLHASRSNYVLISHETGSTISSRLSLRMGFATRPMHHSTCCNKLMTAIWTSSHRGLITFILGSNPKTRGKRL